MLAERGAVVIDADRLYHEAVVPRILPALVERFGESVTLPDGGLDRAALAAVVFGDDEARKALNAITHPAIGRAIVQRVREHVDGGRVVVLDVPLMKNKAQYATEMMVVVTAPDEERVRRLVADRGMTEADARARVAAQAADLAGQLDEADVVIDNSGTRADLEAQVERLWADLTTV